MTRPPKQTTLLELRLCRLAERPWLLAIDDDARNVALQPPDLAAVAVVERPLLELRPLGVVVASWRALLDVELDCSCRSAIVGLLDVVAGGGIYTVVLFVNIFPKIN